VKPTTDRLNSECKFRADLWKAFVANYQVALAASTETFARYCEEFRKRWFAGA